MRTGLRVTYAGSGGSKRDLDPITPRCFGAISDAFSKAKKTVDHSFCPRVVSIIDAAPPHAAE